MKKNLSSKDYEFMHSLSEAVLQKTPFKIRVVLYFWVISILAFIIWAKFAYVDEIARGQAKVIPSDQNQIIQNLEGGIVEKIYVKEGEKVKKGQVLVKIKNERSKSSLESSGIKLKALEAKIKRLEAEAKNERFEIDLKNTQNSFLQDEYKLYLLDKKKLNSSLEALKEKLNQKKQELQEAYSHKRNLKQSLEMITTEVQITRPMVQRGIKSKIDFLKLQREQNDIKDRYESTRRAIPRLQSAIKEIKNQIDEKKFNFQTEARKRLLEALKEYRALKASSSAIKDSVTRTFVKSPMDGIVQTLYVNTIGGVIKPGEDILEIVPDNKNLLIDVKIKPKDIAFIYYGQKAIVKFSAYDFSIYGGLIGKVVLISPDTTKDEKGNVFYTVRVKTDQNFISYKGKELKIIPGMTASVDIITGKKSILDYILKPILKTKYYTFSER